MTDIEKVLAGGLADMAFTDPPYNVAYEGETAQKLTIDNDALDGKFYEFPQDASANMLAMTKGACPRRNTRFSRRSPTLGARASPS